MAKPKKVKEPYKFDEEKQKAYCDNLAHGVGRVRSAQAIGISTATIYNYLETDRKFARMVKEAEESANEQIVDVLWQIAKAGDAKAIKIWTDHHWNDTKKVQIGGDPENPVKVEVSVQEKMKAYEEQFKALESETESDDSSDDLGE
jgi:hypothetical protein